MAAALSSVHQALIVLADLAIRSAMLLPVRMDFVGVLACCTRMSHLGGGSRNCTAGFHLHYTDVLQKFRNRASSGNPVIYNCSNPGLCGRKFLFLLPHIPTEGTSKTTRGRLHQRNLPPRVVSQSGTSLLEK